MSVNSGECARCKHNALLYAAMKGTERVWICWECREFIKELMLRKAREAK